MARQAAEAREDGAVKVAIVTGGGSGIGAGLCRELARRGVRVVVADLRGPGAHRVADAITAGGGLAEARTLDVSSEPDVRGVVTETAARYGRLDYLFNNAGLAIGGDTRDLTVEHWRQVLDVDLYGVLYGCLAAYPIMARQGFGHIVNTSSAAAFVPDPGNAPYATAKHALVGLSLSLRLEGEDLGVQVSVVCPGFVRSNVYANAGVVNLPAVEALDGRERERVLGAPARMMAADQAARVVMDGVARNTAVIVFPATIRWVRRLYLVWPRPVERSLVRTWHGVRAHRAPTA
jgi:NAD(P)-dependent dehydrogenase (short-subunit alcohol dehydrogenase family)